MLQHIDHEGRLAPLYKPILTQSFEWLARGHVARGLELLSTGSVVVTERLHGHILCLLLGIPHVVLAGNYGKTHWFYKTWTSRFELSRWAEHRTDAMAVARALLDERQNPC